MMKSLLHDNARKWSMGYNMTQRTTYLWKNAPSWINTRPVRFFQTRDQSFERVPVHENVLSPPLAFFQLYTVSVNRVGPTSCQLLNFNYCSVGLFSHFEAHFDIRHYWCNVCILHREHYEVHPFVWWNKRYFYLTLFWIGFGVGSYKKVRYFPWYFCICCYQ